jgi:hypothetical protein
MTYNIRLTDSIYTSELPLLGVNPLIAQCNSLSNALKIAEVFRDDLNITSIYFNNKLHTILPKRQ